MGKVVMRFDDLEPDRERVEIAGAEYELLTMDDFGLIEGAGLQKKMRVMAAVSDEMTKEQEAEYRDAVDFITGKIVSGIEADTVKAMKFRHKEALLTHFFNTVVAQRGAAKEAEKAKT